MCEPAGQQRCVSLQGGSGVRCASLRGVVRQWWGGVAREGRRGEGQGGVKRGEVGTGWGRGGEGVGRNGCASLEGTVRRRV